MAMIVNLFYRETLSKLPGHRPSGDGENRAGTCFECGNVSLTVRACGDVTELSCQSCGLRTPQVTLDALGAASPVRGEILATRNELNEINEISPLMRQKSPPSALHEAAFHGIAGEWVRRIEPHTEADTAALLVQFLLAYGNAIGRKSYVSISATRHYGNLFAVIVGETSSGAKGTSWGEIRYLFHEAFEEWEQECIKSGLSSGEGLIHAVRDPLLEKEAVKDKAGIITRYQEIIKDEGVEEKRLLVVEEEFARTLQAAQRQGNTLSAIVRQAWDRGKISSMTKSPYTATDAHISMIGQITPTELKCELTDTETANGFANRFLWVFSKSPRDLPFGGELWRQDLIEPLTRLYDAIRFGEQQKEVTWSDEARPVWFSVYPTLKEDRPGLMGSVTARARPQVLRLSLLYSLLDQSETIEAVHIQAALAVWDYSELTADYLFGASLGDPTADTILAALRGQPGGMTRTAISALFGRNKKAEEISRALETLRENGLAKQETLPALDGGRPTENWRAVQ